MEIAKIYHLKGQGWAMQIQIILCETDVYNNNNNNYLDSMFDNI